MTLDICGERTIKNPTPKDIRTALFELDSLGDSFLILGPNDRTYIQCGGDPQSGFDLEYQDGSAKFHYRAIQEEIDAETILIKLLAYADGDESWKDDFDWEKI